MERALIVMGLSGASTTLGIFAFKFLAIAPNGDTRIIPALAGFMALGVGVSCSVVSVGAAVCLIPKRILQSAALHQRIAEHKRFTLDIALPNIDSIASGSFCARLLSGIGRVAQLITPTFILHQIEP